MEKVYNVDIHETYTAQAILQNKEDPFKDKCPKGWEHAIVLETKERKYNLFAKDYNFKCRFMFVLEECMKEKEQFM